MVDLGQRKVDLKNPPFFIEHSGKKKTAKQRSF